MKAIKVVFWGAVFLIMAQPSISMAVPYSGAWMPNDGDIFSIQISSTNADASFHMYDCENIGNDIEILDGDQYDSATVYFTQDSGVWYAGLTSGATTLNLGADLEFRFFFFDSSGSGSGTIYSSYDVVTLAPLDSYQLTQTSFDPDMVVVVHDVMPIPDPAAIFLLGSACLIGFAAARRKFIK